MLSLATVALRPDNTLYPAKHSQPMASLLSLNGHELTECSQSTMFKMLNFFQTPPPHPPTHRRGVQTPAPLSRRARGRKGQGTGPGSPSGCSAVRNRVSTVYSRPQTGRTTLTPRPPDPGSQSRGACGGESEECKSGLLLLGRRWPGAP